MPHDSKIKVLIELAKEGKTRQFWLEDELLYTKGRHLYVPLFGSLRKKIIKECHDSKWAGHPGVRRTIALVEETYYWPRMEEDIEAYVKTCLVCQQDKVEQQAPAGLLEPLPIPSCPWESISMDYITSLPESEGFGCIIVVVDRFLKYGVFILVPKDYSAEQTA